MIEVEIPNEMIPSYIFDIMNKSGFNDNIVDSELVNWVLYRLKLKVINIKRHDDMKKLYIEIEEVEE